MAGQETSGGWIGETLERLAGLESRHRALGFEELREGVLSGRAGAWRRFVERYSRFVYSVALKMLAGVPERDEAAAQIYARVFERLAARSFALLRGFRGTCRFTTYLYRIVQTERRELFERRDRTRAEETVAIPEQPVAPGNPVLAPAGIRELARRALEELQPEDRLVLLFRFRDGLKLREIAVAGGYRNLNQAAHALRRALGRMRLLRRLREERRMGEEDLQHLAAALRSELLEGEDPVEERA